MSLNYPHRVSVMSETRIEWVGGAFTTTWTSISLQWANCQVMSVSNDEAYNKKQQFTKWKVFMRYLGSLTNKNKLVFEGRQLRVEGVKDVSSRKNRMVVICEEEFEVEA
jgi:head-tail adaptor